MMGGCGTLLAHRRHYEADKRPSVDGPSAAFRSQDEARHSSTCMANAHGCASKSVDVLGHEPEWRPLGTGAQSDVPRQMRQGFQDTFESSESWMQWGPEQRRQTARSSAIDPGMTPSPQRSRIDPRQQRAAGSTWGGSRSVSPTPAQCQSQAAEAHGDPRCAAEARRLANWYAQPLPQQSNNGSGTFRWPGDASPSLQADAARRPPSRSPEATAGGGRDVSSSPQPGQARRASALLREGLRRRDLGLVGRS